MGSSSSLPLSVCHYARFSFLSLSELLCKLPKIVPAALAAILFTLVLRCSGAAAPLHAYPIFGGTLDGDDDDDDSPPRGLRARARNEFVG